MENVLEVRDLTKTYGDKMAVDGLSLTVAPGEIHGFIGHNGSGKTTTIRAVVGVMAFDFGEVLIDGLSVREKPVACKARTAYIPDNPDLYEYATGIQYLSYLADIFRVSVADREERIVALAGDFGIMDSLGNLIGSYSHGMRQKLALIGAFLHDPRLLVLDEPFVGLDPQASYRLKELMRDLCDRGSAIFFSTHVLDVAEKLCDRVTIIKQGRLVASGTVGEVRGSGSLEDAFLEVIGDE